MLVSSVPLSETQVRGLPRTAMIASSSRATRRAGDRGIRNQRQALAGEVVDHGEDAEPPAIGERVRDEVERPALVRPAGISMGLRVPSARLRPPRRRTWSFSSL